MTTVCGVVGCRFKMLKKKPLIYWVIGGLEIAGLSLYYFNIQVWSLFPIFSMSEISPHHILEVSS